MTVTNKDKVTPDNIIGTAYARACANIRQLDLRRLRLVQTFLDREIISRKIAKQKQEQW